VEVLDAVVMLSAWAWQVLDDADDEDVDCVGRGANQFRKENRGGFLCAGGEEEDGDGHPAPPCSAPSDGGRDANRVSWTSTRAAPASSNSRSEARATTLVDLLCEGDADAPWITRMLMEKTVTEWQLKSKKISAEGLPREAAFLNLFL
jgi:hypothetical protein